MRACVRACMCVFRIGVYIHINIREACVDVKIICAVSYNEYKENSKFYCLKNLSDQLYNKI